MATQGRKTGRNTPLPLLFAAVALAAGFAAAGLASQITAMGPRLGDIIAFEPNHETQGEPGLELAAGRADGTSCVMDLDVIRRAGGSLIMERKDAAATLSWHVHWAGGRTSDGPANCGAAADLMLSAMDVTVLAAAAGGFGVSHAPIQPGR